MKNLHGNIKIHDNWQTLTKVESIFGALHCPLNLHCIWIRTAAVHTPNTLIKYTALQAPWIYTASELGQLQCALLIHWSSTLQTSGHPESTLIHLCLFSGSVQVHWTYTPAHCSVFSVCTEDSKQSTFSAALQVPWNYTEPSLHFDGVQQWYKIK